MKQPGYIERLAAFIAARQRMPLAWGTNDCAVQAADAAIETTGTDLLGALRGSWSDESTALAVLAQAGGLMAAMDLLLPRVPVPRASRGDIVLTRVDGVAALATVFGASAFGPGPDGIVWTPIGRYARIAWKT